MEKQNSESPPEPIKAAMAKSISRVLGNWLPVVLLTLGSLWLLQGAVAHTSNHGVIVRGADYDAGAVKEGATVKHSVRLVNLSAQLVRVDAQPGCGCTVVQFPQQTLKPLRMVVIKVQVNTEGMGKGLQRRAVELNMQTRNTVWQDVTMVGFRLI